MVQNMIKYHPGTAHKNKILYFSYNIDIQLKNYAHIRPFSVITHLIYWVEIDQGKPGNQGIIREMTWLWKSQGNLGKKNLETWKYQGNDFDTGKS